MRRSNYVPGVHIAEKVFHILFLMNRNSVPNLLNCSLFPVFD